MLSHYAKNWFVTFRREVEELVEPEETDYDIVSSTSSSGTSGSDESDGEL